MKTDIKKLTNYPVSVTAGTYVTGTECTLDSVLHNPFFIQLIEQNREKLVCFKGEWKHNSTFFSAAKSSAIKGDYWIWTGRTRGSVDMSLLLPNSVVYYDGTYMKTFHFREHHDTEIKPKYDVCIIGGGAGGVGAGYALRNQGYRVCIVEAIDALGGTHCNAGVGLMIATPIGDWYKTLAMDMYNDGILGFYKWAVSGNPYTGVGDGSVFDKAFRSAQFTDAKSVINGFSGNNLQLADIRVADRYRKDLTEGGIDVLTNYELVETISVNGVVDEVRVRSVETGQIVPICADYYIDCSGDGVLFTNDQNLVLDTDYYVGADPRDRFNESAYPSGYQGDHSKVNYCEPVYYITLRNYWSGEGVPSNPKYKRYSDLLNKGNFEYRSLGDLNVKQVSKSYSTNMSGEALITKSRAWNYADGLDRAIAFTSGEAKGVQKLLGIRETFRIKCEKMLTTADLQTQATSANLASSHAIALSTWYCDIHSPSESYSVSTAIPNGIPYESIIPCCYSNALVACRAYGASHLALSSCRLAKTMLELGHSAGTAILQLLESNVRGDVRTVDVAALQTSIGIADLMDELEEYFFGSSVDYEVLGS